MNFKSFLLASAFFACFSASAQSFSYGVKAGFDANTSSKPVELDAYQAGMFLQFGGRLYVQPEAYFCLQSGSMKAENSYLRVPLLVGYQLFDLKVVGMHLMVGPTFNKQLVSGAGGVFTWGFGGGLDFFHFLTTDLRYSFKRENQSLLINSSRLNLTFGVRL